MRDMRERQGRMEGGWEKDQEMNTIWKNHIPRCTHLMVFISEIREGIMCSILLLCIIAYLFLSSCNEHAQLFLKLVNIQYIFILRKIYMFGTWKTITKKYHISESTEQTYPVELLYLWPLQLLCPGYLPLSSGHINY